MAKSGGDKHEKNAEISSFGRILYGFWRLFSSRMVWPRSAVCKTKHDGRNDVKGVKSLLR